MAGTLLETMSKGRTVRKGGKLVREAQPDTQALATESGLPAAPITPAGVSGIGGNEHQAKMAGTPAQKQQALAASSEGSLAETMRRQQARTTATTSEEETKKKGEQAGQLSDLQAKAQSFIEAATTTPAMQAAGTGVTQEQTVTQDSAELAKGLGVSSLSADDAATLRNIAKAGYPADQLASYANKLGMTAADFEGRLRGAIASEDAQRSLTAKAAAGALADKATVADLRKQGLGGDMDDATLANLLGVPTEQLAGMTITDLQNKIAELEQASFTRTQATEQQLSSGLLGGAEAEAARQQLKDFSGVGVRSSEAEMARVEDAVARGDTIKFAGQDISIKDLLSDETITKYVQDYLANPESEFSKALLAQNPDFVKFITDNKKVFTDAAASLETSIGTIKAATGEQTKVAESTGMSGEVLRKFMPEYGSLTATASIPPLLRKFADAAAGNEGMKQALQQMTPAMVDQLREWDKLGDQAISSLEIGKPGGVWDRWTKNQQTAAALEKIGSMSKTDPAYSDEVIRAIYGVDPATIKDQVKAEQNRARLGLRNNLAAYDLIVDDYGNMEGDLSYALDSIRAQAQSGTDLPGAIAGRGFTPASPAPAESLGDVEKWASEALGQIDTDGNLTPEEVMQAFPSIEDLDGFLSQFNPPSLDAGERQTLATTLNQRKQKLIADARAQEEERARSEAARLDAEKEQRRKQAAEAEKRKENTVISGGSKQITDKLGLPGGQVSEDISRKTTPVDLIRKVRKADKSAYTVNKKKGTYF